MNIRFFARVFLTLFAFFGCAGAQEPVSGSQRQLTVADIFGGGGLTGRFPESLAWSPDGDKFSYLLRDDSGEKSSLLYVDVNNGRTSALVIADKLATMSPPLSAIVNERTRERITRYSIPSYHWAPDSQHLLFSSRGQLWYFRLDNGTGIQLTSSSEPAEDPKFSTSGKELAFIRRHNLVVHDLEFGREIALTNDTHGALLNGEVDWVYQEELDVRSNYFWSPDGKQIVYLQMNEEPVPEYPIVDWLTIHPGVDLQRYPKAGDPNPSVRVGVVSHTGGTTKWLYVGEKNTDSYVPRFGWISNRLVYIEVLNRAQNQLDLYFVDPVSGRSRRVLSETSDAWVPVNDDFRVLRPGSRFLWSSWRDGFNHLYLYSFDPSDPLGSDAKLERQLTRGAWEVTGLDAADEDRGLAYITTNRGDPRNRILEAITLNGQTQWTIEANGTHSDYFSSDNRHYVDAFSSLTEPPRLKLCDAEAQRCGTPFWSSTAPNEYGPMPVPKTLELKTEDGTTLYGTLLLPMGASPESRAPLVNNPYGGPGAMAVRNEWGGSGFFFDQLLANAGFAVLHVDNRGMSGRGKAFAAAVQYKLGQTELRDQIGAIDQVLRQFPQIDGSRMGWWGWSYGGFMTLYALSHSDRFRAGVAVAPVADWRDYDSIYTERYMGLPAQHQQAYNDSAPILSADKLHGNLLLAHGTSDDNVHAQNSLQMAQRLIQANKQFQLMLYPRETHSIPESKDRIYLYESILRHFITELTEP